MRGRKVYLETFGCQMNELDSELVVGQLSALGYEFTPEADAADVVMFNTCSVREHAEQKVWSRLGELAIRKRREPGLVVGVLGCLAERDGPTLTRRMPVVDILCGPAELDKLPRLIDNAARTRASLAEEDRGELTSAGQVALAGDTSRRTSVLAAAEDRLELLDLSRAISPVDHAGDARRTAYVRITRGCNKFCTYCVVPYTRGAEVHRPPHHIVEECRRLQDAGVVEVTLLGQTVNHYRFEHGASVVVGGVTQPQKGRSHGGGHRRDPFASESVTTFADLLRMIHEACPGIQRLRFVTSYPRDFGDDVLEVMRDHDRICRYLHVPAQSGSNRILKLMNRGYVVEEYEDFLARARAHLHRPEQGRPLMISGDFIVGFPSETEEDFRATLGLVERAGYKSAFIFKYSPRPGTTAFDRLADDVPEEVKRDRNTRLLDAQGRVSQRIAGEHVGARMRVMVEGLSKRSLKDLGMTKSQIRRSEAVSLTVGGRAPSPAATLEADPERLQLASRTDGDVIVHFEAPAARARSLVGSLVDVDIISAERIGLVGRLVE